MINQELRKKVYESVNKNLSNPKLYSDKTKIVFIDLPSTPFKDFQSIISYTFHTEVIEKPWGKQTYIKPRPTKKNNRKQILGYSRSIEDMYICCKTYFPNIELDEVFNYIIGKLHFAGYCYTHRKYMFRRTK